MRISKLIEELERTKSKEGDIETTCTWSTLPEDKKPLPDVFETTVEHLQVGEHPNIGKRVRLCI